MILVLSTIIIAALVVCSLDVAFAAPAFGISPWFFIGAIWISIAVEVAIDAVFAIITKFLPEKWVSPESKIFKVSKGEQRFCEFFGVKKWKDKYWDLGGLGGFSKKKMVDPNSAEYIRLFIIESNKGVVDHLIGMFAGFLVILIYPLKFALVVGIPVAIVNFVLNAMPMMILRYNIPKLQVLYKRLLRNEELKKKQQQEIQEDKKEE